MSRFSNCRDTDLASTVRGCKCNCKRGGKCPCIETYITGTQIHPDPSVENQLAITGGGPLGDEIPEIDNSGGGPFGIPHGVMYWPSTLTQGGIAGTAELAPRTAKWAQLEPDTNITTPRWKISTASPRSGTYHLRWTKGPDALEVCGQVLIVGLTLCPTPYAMTAVVIPGDLVRVAGYGRQLGGTDGVDSQVRFQFYDSNVNPVGSLIFSPFQSIMGAYTRLELSSIAPANAAYVKSTLFLTTFGTTNATTVDCDDVEVEVT